MNDFEFDAGALGRNGWTTFGFPVTEDLATAAAQLLPTRAGELTSSSLTPRAARKGRPHSLSDMYGLDAFEAHTDGGHLVFPPRWSLMRLAKDASTQTPTMLWDFESLGLSDRLLSGLRRSMWVVRGGGRSFYSSILREGKDWRMVRFNRACMSPVSRSGESVAEELVSSLTWTTPIEHVWRADCVLVLDNWRVLHARPAVSERDASTRRIDRLLISGEDRSGVALES
jgi:hypothetical protein